MRRRPRFFKLFQPELDITFRPESNLDVRILERPGRILSVEEQRVLITDIKDLTQRCVKGMDLDYGIFKENSPSLNNAVLTLIRDTKTGNLIAFNALSIMDLKVGKMSERVIHLGLVMIDPSVRARGLSWLLYGLTVNILFLRNHLDPIWISNVSQVPSIIGMVEEGFANAYPAPLTKHPRSLEHLLLARAIMKDHRSVFGVGDDCEFDEEKFIIKNAYTGGSDNLKKTWEEAPKHRNDKINEFCHEHLDYQRGDDFLQIAQLKFSCTRSYAMKSIPRKSLLHALYLFAFLTIESLLLPFYQWFIVQKPQGNIRPYKHAGDL